MGSKFKRALVISLSAHIAAIMFFSFRGSEKAVQIFKNSDLVELDYILINNPKLAEEGKEEVFCKSLSAVIEKGDFFESEKEQSFLKYYNLVRERIRSEIGFLGKNPVCKEIKIIFTLNPDGKLQKVDSVDFRDKILFSCVDEKEIIRNIWHIQPFPPFPREMGRMPITFSLPIRFVVN